MRPVLTVVALALLLSAVGCNRYNTRPDGGDAVSRLPQGTPQARQLVDILNRNAQTFRSLESVGQDGVFIDAKQDGQQMNVSATLACQKPAAPGTPPNFRLQARVVGNTEVDIGSNSEEFWYWIKRAPDPYVFHCSYADFRAGRARTQFPFQPEWVVEALGMADYDPKQTYEVRQGQNTVELVQRTTSPQGQPIQKVTVFNRNPAQNRAPQVMAHILRDAGGKEICTAQILQVQADRSGVVVPRLVFLRWPQAKLEMKMDLRDVRVNAGIDEARAARLFSRRDLAGVRGYDLARGPDAGTSPIQPAGGFTP
jgi:hypothetical protein